MGKVLIGIMVGALVTMSADIWKAGTLDPAMVASAIYDTGAQLLGKGTRRN